MDPEKARVRSIFVPPLVTLVAIVVAWEVAVRVLKKSAELGLTAILTPERYGGMELDLASAMIAAEHLSRDGSYSSKTSGISRRKSFW